MSGERQSGEDRWREFSNSFKARSAAESSSEQSRSLSVRISTARRSVADDAAALVKSARNASFAVRRSSRWSVVRRETPDSRRSGTLPGRRERRMSQCGRWRPDTTENLRSSTRERFEGGRAGLTAALGWTELFHLVVVTPSTMPRVP